jgi:hypothetical protein
LGSISIISNGRQSLLQPFQDLNTFLDRRLEKLGATIVEQLLELEVLCLGGF